MTIQELINEIKEKKISNNKINPTGLDDFLKEKLEIKEYLPFVEKREICKTVLDASCTKVGGIVEVDSVTRYLLFTITMISKYTNIKFGNNEGKDPIDEYDMLCQSDLLNPILDIIGNEYAVCNNLLNMMMADINANNNIVAVVEKSAQKILDIIDDFANVLSEKVESLNLDLSQIDLNKYKGLIENITK